MSLPALAAAVLAALALGYRFYGRYVASRFALDDGRPAPATALADGVDFVPTRPFYLLGQHFSAIAAAGPIAGPILACQQFGWLPCLLWIGVGTKEPDRMKQGIEKLHNALVDAKIEHVFVESPGTDHEWQTWRRNLEDFAPRLFQPAGRKQAAAQRR